MPSRTAEPASPLDGMSPGDIVLGHEASFYRDGSLTASSRPRPGIPGYDHPEPAATDGPPLPMTGVARQVAGTEVNRLKGQVEAGQRDLANRFTFGYGGQQISDPAVIAMRKELIAQIDAVNAEIARIESMDDHEVRVWAAGRGFR